MLEIKITKYALNKPYKYILSIYEINEIGMKYHILNSVLDFENKVQESFIIDSMRIPNFPLILKEESEKRYLRALEFD